MSLRLQLQENSYLKSKVNAHASCQMIELYITGVKYALRQAEFSAFGEQKKCVKEANCLNKLFNGKMRK